MPEDKPMCFVAMPTGRNEAERLAYYSWYRLVYQPAAEKAGYVADLQRLESAPVNIVQEIRRKLVDAPMALFDIGGLDESDAANPNVMYELGIRHSFGKPSILYSVTRPPFDVDGQNTIIGPRAEDFIEAARDRLSEAMRSAAAGHFYNPMSEVETAKIMTRTASGNELFSLVVKRLEGLERGQRLLFAQLDSVEIQTRLRGPVTTSSFSAGFSSLAALGQDLRPRPDIIGTVEEIPKG
jgi:hypothetical protein